MASGLLQLIDHLRRREARLVQPLRHGDFALDIVPVVHRARDTHHHAMRRQKVKRVLAQTHQLGAVGG
ncbi:hypothetical protein GCM10027563_34780 [Parasphingorhabdus pacifica]